ncbi:type II toxin-antitoxin system VapC family toxin [Salibaculum sp.]|uniref:type II toxin-antitoxin system VapC family toxin n=1 Tax=Roseovarius halophilus (ex Wu et al. 2025) TaxID=3376060 RepID=UPI0028705418|nr:type II toxin-antitoxin system VapC family toxin [Salibaculum sp.]MDR9429050.1 type II toxin-antitoxin system VapC family toxin [Salibaculum sp.]
MYVLDTNVLSALRRPDRAPKVANWLREQPERQLFLSVITLGEIERGIAQQEQRNPEFAADLRAWIDRTLLLFGDRLLPFGPEEARLWGRLSARLGHSGADLLIAATALSHGAIVVTGNVTDFEPTGVEIVDPF